MSDLLLKDQSNREITLQKLAREIAYGVFPLEEILEHHQITPDDFEGIKKLDYFQRVLSEAVESWNSAANTTERTKLKISAAVEEVLPDMVGRLYDTKFGDTARVELFKTLMRSAGMLDREGGAAGTGEKISISINMGTDKPVTVEAVTPRVIDYDGAEDA